MRDGQAMINTIGLVSDLNNVFNVWEPLTPLNAVTVALERAAEILSLAFNYVKPDSWTVPHSCLLRHELTNVFRSIGNN